MKQKTQREKGLAFQRWIKAWLEEKGWTVVNIPPRAFLIKDKKTKTARFVSIRNDIFGCDLVSRKTFVRTTEAGKIYETRELWIQATASPKASIGRKIEEIKKYPFFIFADTQVWIKIDSGKVNVYKIFQDLAPEGLKSRQIGKIIYGKFYSLEEGYEY